MGPRIYNLLPTLAGPVARWIEHLDRIAAMRFDWVYVNPFHATGSSGSIYAVSDYRRLNPALRGSRSGDDDAIVREFADAAYSRGLSVMMDLVANHTAKDSPLVRRYPQWYRRDAAGNLVCPSVADPDDPAHVTVWEDLAELDYDARPERDSLVAYFGEIARHYAALGVRGFRCDAAYAIPADVWKRIIAAVRSVRPDAFFAAETLGCTIEATERLAGAGFDALFNSAKWWDFHSDWLLAQYERFRRIAPSIAFPESHDTLRLVEELQASPEKKRISANRMQAEYRFRYAFAAVFSSGVMLPMGYEYGFSKRFDVVRSRPTDWEKPRFDISRFIAETNEMKASVPSLNVEAAQRLADFGNGAPLALVRGDRSSGADAIVLINPDVRATKRVAAVDILRTVGCGAREVTPGTTPPRWSPRERIAVPPRGVRVFVSDAEIAALRPREPPVTPHPAVIENVRPQLDAGRHAIKRAVGDVIEVTADIFRDGHAALDAAVLYREKGAKEWREAPMRREDNDGWRGSFDLERNARYEYTVEAWPDEFGSWREDVRKKRDAAQPVDADFHEGRRLLEAARTRSHGEDRERFAELLASCDAAPDTDSHAALLLAEPTAELARRYPDRSQATRYDRVLDAICDRRLAVFGAWYELFVRSQGTDPRVAGTFDDAARRLPAIRAMGFDVVYLTPIHPIGRTARKGRNNAAEAAAGDPGSPWAIGNEQGGHMAVEPSIGTLRDFDRFVAAARDNGLEVALDYALQCSPDHPYVRERPEWFTRRADGSIAYAENPPKKYEDIVNFNWYGAHGPALWNELRDVVLFWVRHGVTIFRVDNPHTKPFAFWEWMIAQVQAVHPETIFLSEAFTRPKVMRALAKLGFTQSYTYFTWRNTKVELTSYVEEVATSEMREYFRPNFFANTPDILPEYLQRGGRPAFIVRLVLAATLSSNYGIYSGFELCENAALPGAGREEYADSEKYEVRVRDWTAPGNIISEIETVNRIRRENPALHDWRNVRFYRADDDAVIFYGKRAGDNLLFIAVNLDPFAARETTLWFPTGEIGLSDEDPYDVEELLGGAATTRWRGSPHGVRLDPARNPAAVYRMHLPS